MSPDGSKAIFICDWNLWVRDVADRTGAPAHDRRREEIRLRDEQRRMGDQRRRRRCLWSPDGKKIATQQQDERKVGDMYLVETPVNGGHSELARGVSAARRSRSRMITRVVIDVDTGKMTTL
jgi:Tol biopolymer transport system component